MKTNTFLLLVLIGMVVIGCKHNKSNENSQPKETKTIKKNEFNDEVWEQNDSLEIILKEIRQIGSTYTFNEVIPVLEKKLASKALDKRTRLILTMELLDDYMLSYLINENNDNLSKTFIAFDNIISEETNIPILAEYYAVERKKIDLIIEEWKYTSEKSKKEKLLIKSVMHRFKELK
uniref:hypothetical protein n=1 Tax=uncultured Draconibacterium sp. TaxID=1573823 RepID=UPI0032180EE0